MRTHFLKKRISLSCLFVLLIAISSCKKNNADSTTTAVTTTGVPTTGSRKQLTLDSIFLYAKQIYFWNDVLPDYTTFNPRQYASKTLDLDNYDDELYAISQLKINTTTNKPYEYYGDGYPKYSFIEDLTLANPSATASVNVNGKASVDTEGNGNDIGIRPIFFLTSSSEAGPFLLFVTAVYPGSSAAAAGVQRGWVIQKINGTAVAGKNYTSENAAIISSLGASSVKIEGVNYVDKVPFSLTLTKTSYKSSPVYASKLFTRSGKKIGYLSFARFSALTNGDTPSDTNLDPVFADFSAQGITDLVVDLRYNGGGYINTAEYLADLIAPASLTGKTMFTEFYNAMMQAGTATILANQPLLTSAGKVQYKTNGKLVTYADLNYSSTNSDNITLFNKKGSLSTVTNVVFIVSGNTASASELLINSLKPYMTVQLVGETTYGKPVGFFPITLENRYDVYMSLFETRNSNNEGGYYTGMVPASLVDDDPTYPFGDEREANLLKALNLIAPATVSTSASASTADRSARAASFSYMQTQTAHPHSEFVGMIEKPHTYKK